MKEDVPGVPPPHNESYPENWPDIRQRVVNAQLRNGSLNHNIDTGNDDQELIGFIAQQAVENALKGWIAAIDGEYQNIQDIPALAEIILAQAPDDTSAAREQLDALMEYIILPPDQLARLRPNEPRDWLSLYPVEYRYAGAGKRLEPAEYEELQEKINQAINAMVAHIYRLTGTGPSDLDKD